MLATLAGFLALLLGLSLLLLPLVVTELSRPRDSVWGAVVLLLGLVLVTSAARLTGAPMLAVLCGGLLVGRLGGEVAQGRWRALTDEERQALRSAERWSRSLNQLAAVAGNLLQSGVGAAAGVSAWLAERRQSRSHGKRWVRAESSREAPATDASATQATSTESQVEGPTAARGTLTPTASESVAESAEGTAGSAAQVAATSDAAGGAAPEAAALNPDQVATGAAESAGREIASAGRVPPAGELPDSAAESAPALAQADASVDAGATVAPMTAAAPAPPAEAPVAGSTLSPATPVDPETAQPELRDSDGPSEQFVTAEPPGAFTAAPPDPAMALLDDRSPAAPGALQSGAPEAKAPAPAGDGLPQERSAVAVPSDQGAPVVADFHGIDALLAAAVEPEGPSQATGASPQASTPPIAPAAPEA